MPCWSASRPPRPTRSRSDKPLYGVNHLAAHVAVDELQHGPLAEPSIALLVSGGHSSLLLVPDLAREVESLGPHGGRRGGRGLRQGRPRARAAVPGRPADRQGGAGRRPAAIAFPRGLTGPRDAPYDFSFSGLKTAVARWVEARERAGEPVPVADVAASFQEAVADVLTAKAVRACRDHGVDHLVLGGGVAANSRLRALAEERCAAAGIVLRVPSPRLCTDNGAMVAALGSRLVAAGVAPSAPDLGADSSLPIDGPLTPLSGSSQTSTVGAPATRVTTTTAEPLPGPLSCRASVSGSIGEPRFLTTTRPTPRAAQQRLQLLEVERQHLGDPVGADPGGVGRGRPRSGRRSSGRPGWRRDRRPPAPPARSG